MTSLKATPIWDGDRRGEGQKIAKIAMIAKIAEIENRRNRLQSESKSSTAEGGEAQTRRRGERRIGTQPEAAMRRNRSAMGHMQKSRLAAGSLLNVTEDVS
jgi:hypothetical protein